MAPFSSELRIQLPSPGGCRAILVPASLPEPTSTPTDVHDRPHDQAMKIWKENSLDRMPWFNVIVPNEPTPREFDRKRPLHPKPSHGVRWRQLHFPRGIRHGYVHSAFYGPDGSRHRKVRLPVSSSLVLKRVCSRTRMNLLCDGLTTI